MPTKSNPDVVELTIKTKLHLTKDAVSDLLATALEGGSNYWYVIDEFVEPEIVDFRSRTFADDAKPHRCYDWPFSTGGGLFISDSEGDEQPALFNWEAAQRGLHLMAERFPDRIKNIAEENYDAEDGDIFLQLSLYGQVIFG